MKRILRIFFILSLVCLTLIIQPEGVQAFPPLPSSFYGTVKINNTKVADGTLIEAVVNGKVIAQSYTQMYGADSVYTISIPGDDPSTTTVDGAREGDVISFKVGGIAAQQTGTWHGGTNEQLDLSAVTANTPNTPAPTPTSYPTQTAIPTVNTPIPSTAPTLMPTRVNATQIITSATLVTGGGTTTVGITSSAGDADTPETVSPEELTATNQPAPDQSGEEKDGPASQQNTGNIFWLVALGVIILLGLIAGVWLLLKKLKE